MGNFMQSLKQSGALDIYNPLDSRRKRAEVESLEQQTISQKAKAEYDRAAAGYAEDRAGYAADENVRAGSRDERASEKHTESMETANLDQEDKIVELGKNYLEMGVNTLEDIPNLRKYIEKIGGHPELVPKDDYFMTDGKFDKEIFTDWKNNTIMGAKAWQKIKAGKDVMMYKKDKDGNYIQEKFAADQVEEAKKNNWTTSKILKRPLQTSKDKGMTANLKAEAPKKIQKELERVLEDEVENLTEDGELSKEGLDYIKDYADGYGYDVKKVKTAAVKTDWLDLKLDTKAGEKIVIKKKPDKLPTVNGKQITDSDLADYMKEEKITREQALKRIEAIGK